MHQNESRAVRAAIYARFSTDLQNERSIEDQIALCRSYAQRERLEVVHVFEDRARSGGSVLGREGLMELMECARNKGFDVLVVEALDRLSRDMEDLAGIHKRLSFLGIEIRAVHEGAVNTILVGAARPHGPDVPRGQRPQGPARAGRSGARGPLRRGAHLWIRTRPGRQGQADHRRGRSRHRARIFNEYVAGRTPRDIAHESESGRCATTARSGVERFDNQRQRRTRQRYPAQ